MTRNNTEHLKSSRRRYLSRRDFIKAAGLATGTALLNACTPTSSEIIPTPTKLPESIPDSSATPFPKENETLYPADIVNFTEDQVLQARNDFKGDRTEVSWYDADGNLQTLYGSETPFELVGGFDIRDSTGNLPNGKFGIVTWPGGGEHFANQLSDGSWIVLTYTELVRPEDGHIFQSFTYSSEDVMWPILSVETDQQGNDTGNNFYFEMAYRQFYRLNGEKPGKGLPGLAMMAMSGFQQIPEGQRIMDGKGTTWNFSWSQEGYLQIKDGETVLYDYWDPQTAQWREALPPLPPVEVPPEIMAYLGVQNWEELTFIYDKERDYWKATANGFGALLYSGDQAWTLGFKPLEYHSVSPDIPVSLGNNADIPVTVAVDQTAFEWMEPIDQVSLTPGGAFTMVRGILGDLWNLQSGEDLTAVIDRGIDPEVGISMFVGVEDTTTPHTDYKGKEIIGGHDPKRIVEELTFFSNNPNVKNRVVGIEVVIIAGAEFQGEFAQDVETDMARNGDPSYMEYCSGVGIRYNHLTQKLEIMFSPLTGFAKGFNTSEQVAKVINMSRDVLTTPLDYQGNWYKPSVAGSDNRHAQGYYIRGNSEVIVKKA